MISPWFCRYSSKKHMSESISLPLKLPSSREDGSFELQHESTERMDGAMVIPCGNLREDTIFTTSTDFDHGSYDETDDEIIGSNDEGLEHEGYDTDLETEGGRDDYDPTGRITYLNACKEYSVTPASYYMRHMTDETLQMSHHGLGVPGAKALAASLMTNTFVVRLNIADNHLGSDGIAHVCNMLKENCYITELDISDNKIGVEGLINVVDVLLTTNNLRVISLSGNLLGKKAAEQLTYVLESNNTLKSLNLSNNLFEEEAGIFLGPSIAANEALSCLNLSWNHLRRKGAFAVALSLKENIFLKTLDLSWNGFGDDGALALGEALKYNSTLIELDISNNRITAEGADHLYKGLLVNETLQRLKIGQNPLQSPGAMKLLNVFKNNPNTALQSIDLTDIQVSSDVCNLLRELSILRPSLIVNHGGSGGADDQDTSRPKPMKILKQYIKNNEMRLLDFFSMLDKDKSMSLTVSEFASGLKENGIPLKERELITLLKSLDKNNDGVINYSEFVTGSLEQIEEDRKDLLKKKAKKKKERDILSEPIRSTTPRSPSPRIK